MLPFISSLSTAELEALQNWAFERWGICVAVTAWDQGERTESGTTLVVPLDENTGLFQDWLHEIVNASVRVLEARSRGENVLKQEGHQPEKQCR